MTHLALCFAAILLVAGPEGIIFQDGKEVPGRVMALVEGGLRVEGLAEPIPLHELNAIVLSDGKSGGADAAADFDGGPMVRFREGETVRGYVSDASGNLATVQLVSPAPGKPPLPLKVPLEVVRGFRLREVLSGDNLFETDLAAGAPGGRSRSSESVPASAGNGSAASDVSPSDVVYVRRSGGLLRVPGVLQSMDADYLTLNFDGKPKRLRRDLVLGIIFAPVATSAVESEIPAVFELEDGGQLPAFFRGIRGEAPQRSVILRFRGARSDDVQEIPESWIRRIRFSSDRVVFLSSIAPALVEETPLLGSSSAFPWRKNVAASGGPLRMGGRIFRKGIGVHSKSVLEFDIEARYRSLAGTIGLDESAGQEAGVTFRVLADGKEIYKKGFVHGDKPENISLPMDGVRRLRLDVDYGEDGVDFGDHADWADLRVAR